MKKFIYFLLISLCWSCAQQTDVQAVRAEIEKTNAAFMKAVESQDAEALAGMYAEDAQMLGPNMEAIQGRNDIKGFFDGAFKSGVTKVNIVTSDVSASNDFAVEKGT